MKSVYLFIETGAANFTSFVNKSEIKEFSSSTGIRISFDVAFVAYTTFNCVTILIRREGIYRCDFFARRWNIFVVLSNWGFLFCLLRSTRFGIGICFIFVGLGFCVRIDVLGLSNFKALYKTKNYIMNLMY